nr:protein FAR-RED impaired response 1-like [Tanacetum cinerariifolium]
KTPKTLDTLNVEYDDERTKNNYHQLEKETLCETPIKENRENREDSCEQQNYNKSVHDEGVEEPSVDMTFDMIEELYDFYAFKQFYSKSFARTTKDLQKNIHKSSPSSTSLIWMNQSSSLYSLSFEYNGSSYYSSHDDYLSKTPKTLDTLNVEYDDERTKNNYHQLEKETHYETPIKENRENREDSCEQQNYNKSVHDEGVEEPSVDMTFDMIEELYDFYATHGKKMGFRVFKRSSQKSKTDDDT